MTTQQVIRKSVLRRLVGAAIRRERHRRGVSVQELAVASGVKRHTIYGLERGYVGTSVATFLCLCLAMRADAAKVMRAVQRGGG